MRINFQTINIWQKKPDYTKSKRSEFAFNPFSRSEKDMLQISFSGSYCSPKNFEVKKLANLHCPACGLIMLTKAQIKDYVNFVGVQRGQDLFNALEKYKDESTITNKPSDEEEVMGVYRPFKEKIVEIYQKLALENPTLDLLALTKLHAKRCLIELIDKQMIVIDELRNYVGENFEEGDVKKALLEKIKAFEKQIKGEADETFARKKFVSSIKNTAGELHAKEIDDILAKMPSSESDIDSFFVKYSRAKSAKEIASKFVQQTIPTTEHLVPQAQGGSDSLSNYICDCEDCNNARGTTPFNVWMQTLPNFEERLQKYLNDVRVAIDNGKIEDTSYDSYIEKIVANIEDMSEGEIILDVPEVQNPEKKAIVISRRKREIEKLNDRQSQIENVADSYRKEIEALEAFADFARMNKYGIILSSLQDIDKSMAEYNQKASTMRTALYALQKEVESLQKAYKSEKTHQEKLSIRKELEQKEKQYKEQEAQYNAFMKKIGALKKKKINLKKMQKPFALELRELNAKLIACRGVVVKAEALASKIEKLGNYLQKEESKRAQIDKLDADIQALYNINAQIEAKSPFVLGNTANYNKYFHQKELLRSAEGLIQGRNLNKLDANGNAREVIEIAIKTIKQNIEGLEQLDDVQYFVNLSCIEAMEKERAKAKAKLDEILGTKAEAQALEEEINFICADKTLDEVRSEYMELSKKKQIIAEIFKIGEKRAKFDSLVQIIERNQAALSALENYQDLSNAEYGELIGMIEVDDIF